VVGRLVEQKDVRSCEQQLGKCKAHEPPARELNGIAREILLAEAQPAENRPRLGLDRIPAQVLEALLEPAVLSEKALLHLPFRFGHFLLKQMESMLK